MSAYGLVLFLHSGLRWALLLALLVVLARGLAGARRGRAWSRGDDIAGAVLVGLVDVQLVLGIVLLVFVGPVAAAFLADPRAAMANPVLRFFSVEHTFAMVIALVVAHLGRVLPRRAASPTLRHRRTALWALALLVILLIGMPWPFLAYGRPLLRGLQ